MKKNQMKECDYILCVSCFDVVPKGSNCKCGCNNFVRCYEDVDSN
jgi:hypothetical protein